MIRAGASRPFIPPAGNGALAALSVVLAGVAAACQSSSTGASSCTLAQVMPYPPSPLMLLSDARLEREPDGFFLFGADKDTARWAHIDGQRVAGKEQSAPVPAARLAGPWLAAAGRAAPADTVLIAYAVAAANGVDLQLTVVAAPADGSAPGTPVVVASVVGGAKAGALPLVSLASSRSGMRAALAWTATGSGQLTAVVLGADGHAVGDPIAVDPTTRAGCVAFVPGKSDLSLAYFRYAAAADTLPEWVIAEMREANYVEATLSLKLADPSPTCPLLLATAGGYALAWQSAGGSSLGIYDAATNQFRAHLFSSAVDFGGPSLQPPLAGLGPAGDDFAVVLARVGVGEVWRVNTDGKRQQGTLIFPSEEGNLGGITSAPVGAALYSSYADYERGAAGAAMSGQRYLIETTCL